MRILASSDSRPEGPSPTSVALNRRRVEHRTVAVGRRWPDSQLAQSLHRGRTWLPVSHAPADRCHRVIVRVRCYQGIPPNLASGTEGRQASQVHTEVAVDGRGGDCKSLARHRRARYGVPRESLRSTFLPGFGNLNDRPRREVSDPEGACSCLTRPRCATIALEGMTLGSPRRVRTRECRVFWKP